MNKSQCFEHDIAVRNAWIARLSDDTKFMIRGDHKAGLPGMEKGHRFELYRAVDELVKSKYLETLRYLNQDQNVIHIKGFGPVRQAKEQIDSEFLLMQVSGEVIATLDFVALTKPKPAPVEETVEAEETESDSE